MNELEARELLETNIKIRESIIDNMPNFALKLLREQYNQIYDNWKVKDDLNV